MSAPARVSSSMRLIAALALAIPAAVLTNASFVPRYVRLQLQGRHASGTFDLASPEPLVLEVELVVSVEGAARPSVGFVLNGHPVATVREAAAFTMHRATAPIPIEATRAGANVLAATIEGPDTPTFEARARVRNYDGIAPDMPRAVVVSDAAVAHQLSQRSPSARVIRFVGFFLASALAMWALVALGRARSRAAVRVQLTALVVVPWLAVAYCLATPRHLWIAPETLAAIVVGPWLLVVGTSWLATHRAAVGSVLVITAATVLLLEVALRVVNHVRPTFLFYSESYSRYRGRPGARVFDATFNSRGFNDVEREIARPPHVAFRAVVLGDSFVVGVVPQRANFLRLLETSLASIAPAEVVNLGVAGTGPRDYLSLLVDEGLAYAPDLVLVGFFVGNDLETRARRPHEYSYVATLARALWRLRAAPAAVVSSGETPVEYVDDAPGMSRSRFLEVQVGRAWVFAPGSPRVAEATARTVGYLREIRDLSRRAGAETLVVLLPDEAQVDAALQEQLAEALGPARTGLDFDQPTRAIAEALEKEGIATIDLLPDFRTEAARTRLYKPDDTHWNLAGNRLAAAVLARALEERVRRAGAARAPGG